MTIETIVFQATTICPYHCPQCYMQKGNADISLDAAKEKIDMATGLGLCAIQITGGEPAGYPYLRELIGYAKSKGVYTALATSGYKHSYDYYLALKQSGLDILCISVNDIDESINKKTRDAFGVSIAAIKDAREAGIYCFANVVLTDDNIDNLELLAEYLKKNGVLGIEILRPMPSFDGKFVPKLSEETVKQLDNVVKKYPELFRVENCFKEYWEYKTKQNFVCRDAGETSLFVNVDGSVSPCSKLQQFKYDSLEKMLEDRDNWKGGCCG